MNFFKSVFVEDPTTPPDSPTSTPDPDPDPEPAISESAWSFGGLLKTLATKSESVIETYRKDIEDLGSGLRNETSIIREAASRAVKDLPSSFEAGASVAQGSLETVGQAIDDLGSTVWRSTAQIILGKGKNHLDLDDPEPAKRGGGIDVRYSRFDAQVRGMQGDVETYCSEPEDREDYEDWRVRFWVFDEGRKAEIDRVFGENEVVREVYGEVVPSKVNNETFWRRYFYRLDRLRKAEEARVLIVKKAISLGEGEEEDLSWDLEEEEEEGEKGAGASGKDVEEEDEVGGGDENSGKLKQGEKGAGASSKDVEEEVGEGDGSSGKLVEEEKGAVVEYGKGKGAEGTGNGSESCKDSDISVVSSQSMLAEEVEDLGWDEIEYSGSNDEDGKGEEGVGRTSSVGGSSRVDLRKRLTAAEEEEEDFSWDIEDEGDGHDEHVNKS